MHLKKPRFVVSLSKTNFQAEKESRKKFQPDTFPFPTRRELLKSEGVSVAKGRVIVDWEQSLRGLNSLTMVTMFAVHPLSLARMNAERIAIIKQLRALGYPVAVPYYQGIQSPEIFSRIKGHAKVFKAQAPPTSIFWTRDLWKKIGGKRFMRFTPKGESWLGEEGRSIPLPRNSVLANKSLHSLSVVTGLQKQGYRFYFVNNGEVYSPKLSRRIGTPIYEKHDHVDLLAGNVENVLLVDRVFFEQNKAVFGKISSETGAELVFVPRAEERLYPANFLVLGPGKILMDRAAKETIALMRSKGIEVIPTAVSLRANREQIANVRCLVNEL